MVDGNTGCWHWIGSKTTKGYGRVDRTKLGVGNKCTRAHQLLYILANGDYDRRLYVCHRCDVPDCVNPDHLFLGSPQDNMDDKVRKGRCAVGSMYKSAKLDSRDVQVIRAIDGFTYSQLALIFDVSSGTIRHVIKRLTWKHI